MMVTIGFLWAVCIATVAVAEDRIKITETCENKFCPVGTFCDIREITSCVKPPCRPLAMCLPESINGCKGHPKCPAGEVCVEHRTSCINRSCKKEAKCAREGTCEALECPPSQHCVADPKPKCVKN